MQDPNADTEWNDALRKHSIIPDKPKEAELTEEDIVKMVDQAVKEKTGEKQIEDYTLEELDEVEDDEDDRILEVIRQQRLAEMKAKQSQAMFGDIREISANDYVEHVSQAGEGIWVVLHLFQSGIPLCSLINGFLISLSKQFPSTKFLKSVSTNCIANYPDKNLPTIFVYQSGQMKGQLVGAHTFGGMNLKQNELEWLLLQTGAIDSKLKEDPRKARLAQQGGFSILTRERRAVRNECDSDSGDDDDL